MGRFTASIADSTSSAENPKAEAKSAARCLVSAPPGATVSWPPPGLGTEVYVAQAVTGVVATVVVTGEVVVVVDDSAIDVVVVVATVAGTDVDGGSTASACKPPSAGAVSAATGTIAAVEGAGGPGSPAASMRITDPTSSVPIATATCILDCITRMMAHRRRNAAASPDSETAWQHAAQ